MAELRKCKFSGREFLIRDEDLEMYKRLSPLINGKVYEIPPPTLCRLERDRRRSAFRNERKLHKRKSSLSGKNIISFFDEKAPFKVYSHDEWWSDNWEATHYGRNFDFGRPFFDQFFILQLEVPRPPLVNNKAENSDYCNFADANKNCYMITSANGNQDCYYCWIMGYSKDVADSLGIVDCELMYQCIDCRSCYNLRYCQNCENSKESAFLLSCNSVANSIFCVNLRNKNYYIFNKQVTKEQHEKFMAELDGSNTKYTQALKRFEQFKKDFPIRKANHFVACENVTGDNIFNSKNVFETFDAYDSEDCNYVHCGIKAKSCSDICYYDDTELCYESTSVGLPTYKCCFTIFCRNSSNLFYCDNCHGCRDCFGCVGLRNKQYCVFNRQYSKSEYEELVPRIIEHMRKYGEWGEFFPIKFSLFHYNETIAHEESPVTKEQAMEYGWRWLEEEVFGGPKFNSYVIPDKIVDVEDDICEQILTCEKSGRSYKIILPELNFYRKMRLPVPRICPDQRLKERISLRTTRELDKRNCRKCDHGIETAYAPGRPEVLYCEKCYLSEVY